MVTQYNHVRSVHKQCVTIHNANFFKHTQARTQYNLTHNVLHTKTYRRNPRDCSVVVSSIIAALWMVTGFQGMASTMHPQLQWLNLQLNSIAMHFLSNALIPRHPALNLARVSHHCTDPWNGDWFSYVCPIHAPKTAMPEFVSRILCIANHVVLLRQ